jgi:hypothetical protein
MPASIKAAATREYTYVACPERNRSCLHASDTEITTALHVPRMQMQKFVGLNWKEVEIKRIADGVSVVQSTSPRNHGRGTVSPGLHRSHHRRSGRSAPRGVVALVRSYSSSRRPDSGVWSGRNGAVFVCSGLPAGAGCRSSLHLTGPEGKQARLIWADRARARAA